MTVLQILLVAAGIVVALLSMQVSGWTVWVLVRQKPAVGKVLSVTPAPDRGGMPLGGGGATAEFEYSDAAGRKRRFTAGLPSFDGHTKAGDEVPLDIAGDHPIDLRYSSTHPTSMLSNLGKAYLALGLGIAAIGGLLLLL